MNKTRIITASAACGLAAAMLAGGAFAYLTDEKKMPDGKISVGKAGVILKVNGEDTADQTKVTAANLVCNEKVALQPEVYNSGTVPEVVYLKVTVPRTTYRPVALDGTCESSTTGPLVQFLSSKETKNMAGEGTTVQTADTDGSTVHGGWILVDSKEAEAQGTAQQGTKTFVYGYQRPLEAGATTDPLFDQVQLKNFVQSDKTEGGSVEIVCQAIQSSNVNDASLQGNESDEEARTALKTIYAAYVTQAETLTGTSGTGT